MDWQQVLDRVRAGEDERTELKRWDGSLERMAVAICALANSEGGVVVLGVEDDGRISGVPEDPDKLQERLTGLLQSGLNHPVGARLGRHLDAAGWVHWLEVRRYRGPEPLRRSGRVCVRRGRSSVEPSPQDLQGLYNTFGFVLTEEQVVPGTTPDDVDPATFRDFLHRQGLDLADEPQPSWLDDLGNRGVAAGEDGEHRLTLYGLLCFGRDPQGFAPTRSAWIETVAYAGPDRAAEVALRGEAKGRLDEQVERAAGWVKGLGTRETYQGLRRTDRPLVPPRALREGLVNAVAHRDYAVLGSRVLLEVFSDRLELTSPGELPNHLRAEAVLAGAHPRSRNELMANFLVVKGYMEMRGRGLPIIRREMAEFNGTRPGLVSDRAGGFVRLTLWLDPAAAPLQVRASTPSPGGR